MLSQQNLKRIFVTPEANNDPSIRSKLERDVDNPATDIIVATSGSSAVINSDKLRLQANMMSAESNADGRFKNFQMQIQAWQKVGKSMGAPAGMATGGFAPPPIPPAQPPRDYSDMAFDPPPSAPLPQAPSFNTPPPPSGIQPLQPPPQAPQYPPAGQPMSPPPQAPQYPPAGQPMSPSPQAPQYPPAGQPMQPPPQYPPAGQPMQSPPMQYPPPMEEDDDDPFGNTGDFTPLR